MEAKLLEFRKRKEKEKQFQGSFLKKIFSSAASRSSGQPIQPTKEKEAVPEGDTQFNTATGRRELTGVKQEPFERGSVTDSDSSGPRWKPYILLCLYVLLWLLLWKFFIEIQFGAVYFILSVSYICYKNTRTGPSDPNKLSAYSVFNANQERLDGTFTTEQFEKEIRFGAASVK